MGMVVQHNMNALNAYNKLNTNVAGLKKSSEKLASGYRINRAGDDAAGLAISEKMRSQIKGLNQAVRNSQDGINMIQTYEGAAQESHNILRRMKELASEAANGTYQNEVDRDAVQLEFNQLNDELNQIADTDFNGVAMLNGGQMADGTKAVNGKFTYVADAPRTEKMAWSASDVSGLDGKQYDNKPLAADSLWNNLGLGDDVKSVDLTFTYDKDTDTWSITGSSDMTALKNKANVEIVKGSDYGTAGTPNIGVGATNGKNNGGFSLVSTATIGNANGKIDGTADPAAFDAAGAGYEYANVILPGSELIDGDTVTLTFTRPTSINTAPENIGVKKGTLDRTLANKLGATDLVDPKLTVNGGGAAATNYETTNSDTPLAPMTQNALEAFKGLKDLQFEATYECAADDGATALKSLTLTFADGTSKKLDVANASTDISLQDGTSYTVDYAAGKYTFKDVDGNELITVELTENVGAKAGTLKGDKSTMSFEIELDDAVYSEVEVPDVSVTGGASNDAVSKSNAFNKATAPLTYTDHLILQTGARTKDSVDFTMKYSTDGMGDLKANLDISSRENGLNTANLSLATQKDANYAIDQIDNAINKVSMVRATFGATQNRLEHKIDNLTTTSENLQEAESSIRDTDMASEMMNYTKFNILQQAAQSMLAQANQQPQSILQLLG